MTFAFLFQIQSTPRCILLILMATSARFIILIIDVARIDLARVICFASSGILSLTLSFLLGILVLTSCVYSLNVVEYLCFIFLQYFLNLRHDRVLIRL